VFNLFSFNKKERSGGVALELQLTLYLARLLDNRVTICFTKDVNYSWNLTDPSVVSEEAEQWDFFFSLFGTLNRK
jgi:hypothetical protein